VNGFRETLNNQKRDCFMVIESQNRGIEEPKLPFNSPRLAFTDLGWVHLFLLTQFLLQILLLFPQFGAARAAMRVAAFGGSLFLLVWIPGSGRKIPAQSAAVGVMFLLLLQFFFHTSMNTVLGGLAHCSLYLAILGPLFWVSRLKISAQSFLWLIYILWGFHTLSSIFGVLQVLYPGQYQPFLSTAIQNGPFGGEGLKIVLANGIEVYRPMGLTDVPGGAATAGFYTLLLGVGIALQQKNPLFRLVGIASSVIGLFCIYLSQVRSILIFSIICLIVLAVVLLRQGRVASATTMVTGMVGIFTVVFAWAVRVGGEQTLARILSLTENDAGTVYQQNRGGFLEETIYTLIPQYPLGAGLGRWGPLNGYFGENWNPFTRPLWAEIQWTGWLYDGGVPLILLYVAAIFLICRQVWQFAQDPKIGDLAFWAGVIFAYNIGAIAVTFNYPLFIGQGGMEFWLLNATLVVAALRAKSEQNIQADDISESLQRFSR
jgi:hypothetical protein